MTRAEVRQFLLDGVNELTPALEFGSGLVTDFNSLRSHTYPAVWQLPYSVDTDLNFSAPQDAWDIQLIIAQLDKIDSSPDQYNLIVDACDEIAQKLNYKYRNIVAGYKLITMTGTKREQFVKLYADCLTGVMLSFTLNSPDQTDVC